MAAKDTDDRKTDDADQAESLDMDEVRAHIAAEKDKQS